MNKVLISGTSSGIGKATALKFLKNNYIVYGLDLKSATINDINYFHTVCDTRNIDSLPEISDINILINNAGTIDENEAYNTNVLGYINCIKKYENKHLKSVVNVASTAGHAGFGGTKHAISQAARIVFTKNLALELGKKYKTLVNSVSPGAIITGLEPDLYKNQKLMKQVADENILKRWFSGEEVAEWIYFLGAINTCATGQDVVLDGGELINFNFIKE